MSDDMFGRLPQFHLSSILSKLQCADGLWDIRLQWTDIHKHTCLRVVQTVYLSDDTGQILVTTVTIASFPGRFRLQFLIAYSMQKRRGKAWEKESRA